MNTKKDILAWYLERGKITSEKKAQKDLEDFTSKVNRKIFAFKKVNFGTGKGWRLEIMKSNWKNPIDLYFTSQGENYKIVGF